jgi:serine/threonine protein kinase
MIGQTISHYKILTKLGEGGMGVVYKAHDIKLDRDVALKFLPHHVTVSKVEEARFLQEARAAAILNHPNICTVHAIEKADDQQFIVMECVEGKTLREIVPVGKLQDAISYAIQIAEALQEAHTHGIVHRDIKAENIMVNSKNQVKVMDFGLAKLKGSLKLTKTSSTIGTLAYMAPEQIEGGEADARSDIFSFGVVLFEMLTGHLPFRGEHEAAMMYAIVNQDPEPLQQYVPDAPSELLHILDRALEKDREDRYQTVHDMLIDLRRLKKDSSRVSRQPQSAIPMPAGTPPVLPAEAKKGWSKRVWVGVAGLLVLCAISTIYFLLRAPAAHLNPNRTTVTLKIPFKEIGYPSLSKDGNWVAFSAKDKSEVWDMYMMNTAGGEARRITDEAAYVIDGAAFSPDVSQIVYDCQQLVPYSFRRIKLVASQGGSSRTLADTGIYPKWRPDGARIGFMRAPAGNDREISSSSGKLEVWSITPDGKDSRRELVDTLCSRGQLTFSWSPDGRSITWVRNYPEGYGEVMVRELVTGKERQLTSDRKKVDEVTWAANDQILYVSNKSGQPNLWTIPAGGGETIQVTEGAAPISAPRISADNKTLVYLITEIVAHVWISSIDGSNARQLTFDDTRALEAAFSHDRKNIAFVLGDVNGLNPERHLYVMDREGNNQRQLTSGMEVDWACQWSPDGNWLSYSSRAVGEPGDSSRVYLIQPVNPGSPRALSKGAAWWFDNERLLVFDQMKTRLYSIKGGTSTQLFEDSTWVFPMRGNNLMVFYDFRPGRDGWWVVPVDSLGKRLGDVRKVNIPFESVGGASPPDRRFFVNRRGYDLWRVWVSTGKKERIGKALPGDTWMKDVSMDGREILWVSTHWPSKLVLVKNVFE